MMPARGLPLVGSLMLALVACTPRSQTSDDTGPAPVDTGTPLPVDTAPGPDTSVATPPITPSQSPAAQDTPPARTPDQSPGPSGKKGTAVSQAEYEGWRQYSVNCARCHGQDVLPNPVAANLLVSLAPGGPMDSRDEFVQVVSEGRPDRGMPAFKSILTPTQTQSIYAYVKGRADKRIPPGRPEQPGG